MLDDAVDRFLLGLLYEPARIDDHDFGVLGLTRQFESARDERTQHDFGIHLVFGTSKVDETDGGLASCTFGIDETRCHRHVSLRDDEKDCQRAPT